MRRPPSTSLTPQKTASGLFLPSASTQGPVPEGMVIAVGPGAPGHDGTLVPVSLKAGDRVVLPGFGGVGVKVGEDVRFSRLARSADERRSTPSSATSRSSPRSTRSRFD